MLRRVAPTMLILAFSLVTCAGITLTAVRASAVFSDLVETGRPGYLTLALDTSTPLQTQIAPGASVRWLVEASLHDASSGTLDVELRVSGDLARDSGMTATVEACSEEFNIATQPASCQGTLEVALPTTPVASLPTNQTLYQLASLQSDNPRQVLITVSIPSTTPDALVEDRAAQIGLGVHSTGDDPQVAVVPPIPPTRLATTGADLFALSVLAIGLVGLGAASWLRSRSRAKPGGAR